MSKLQVKQAVLYNRNFRGCHFTKVGPNSQIVFHGKEQRSQIYCQFLGVGTKLRICVEINSLSFYRSKTILDQFKSVWTSPNYFQPVKTVLHWNQIQGVLCLHYFLRLWKNNCVSRKPCKQRSDLVLNGQMRVPK